MFASKEINGLLITGLAVTLSVASCGKSPQKLTNTNPGTLGSGSGATGKPQQTQTSPNPESPITGAEVWNVSGTNYNVEGTSLLTLGNGETLFVIKVLCDFLPDRSHKPIARSLAKYGVDHGYVKKVKQSWWNGKPQQFSGNVGVALIQKLPAGSSIPSSGYRYNFTVTELQAE